MRNTLKFILPFLLWIYLFHDFILGAIPFNMDTNTIYGVAKFYFNNLLNGVVPLWDPFVSLGHPFYALAICNLFNPVTLIMPLFKLCGASYNVAFAAYIVAYFWVGCIGFYFLVKEVLRNKDMAYLGYLGFLFSSVGVSIFTQLTFIEILVPTIWFFYFLLRFKDHQIKGNFLGLAYSLMIAVSSYLPFYFLTVVGVFMVAALILFPNVSLDFIFKAARFKIRHWLLSLLCLAGIVIAASPLLAYKMLDASGDAVSPGRHCQYTSAEDCYNRTISHQGGMLYEEIARSGGLGERFDIGYLFSYLDKLTYGSDSLLFVPFLIYLLVFLGIFLRCDRINILLVAMMTTIGLIALGSAGPLHRFLFDHVFFFKYFRNLFFLGVFLIPLILLFSLKQLQALLAYRPWDVSRKKVAVVGIIAAHIVAALFLKSLGGIMAVTWWTLILSGIFFSLHYVRGHQSRFSMPILIIILLLQPLAMIKAYTANAVEFKCVLPSQHVVPQFGWVRPDKPATSTCRIYQFVPYEDFWYAMSMEDAPAIVGYPQAASRLAFMLSKQMGDQALAQYAKYKVYLFDDLTSPGLVITGPNNMVKVKHFDVNRIVFEVDLPKKKMLVYNDAHTMHWGASIDGKKTDLLAASGAFKGVWVEAGQHTIEFKYSPPGGQWVYILTTVILFAFLIFTAIMLRLRK